MSVASRTSHYLDHAASTPMLPTAIEAMTAVLGETGNAASLHTSGRRARRRVEESREAIARDLGARPSEVIFTGGGTESDNLAIKGIYWARRDADPRLTTVIAASIEHHAVIDPVEWLVAHEGARVIWLPVDEAGFVAPQSLRAALDEAAGTAAVVSVMWANNEVGTVQPIAELAAIATEYGVPMHSDAVGSAGHLAVDFAASGLAALSIGAHKFGGPIGVGALLLRRDVTCVPLLHGGGHERDVRSGTPDVAGVVAMAAALADATENLERNTARIDALRARLVAGLVEVPGASLSGPTDPALALPTIVHASFAGCEGDSLLMLLDAKGIEVSTGSACTAGVARASHVLLAMGRDSGIARGSLRFSFGFTSTDADVDAVLTEIGPIVERARAAGLTTVGGRR